MAEVSVAKKEASAKTIDRLLDRVDELGVLPHVIWKVLEITSSSEGSAAMMERAITVDPGFSGKLLILANSAAFGLPRRVSTVREAVLFLGFRTVRSMAMTVATFDMFVGKTDCGSLRRRGWWRHSVDTAVCARWLADRSKDLTSDEAYTAGLLHLLGKNLLDRFGTEPYEEVLKLVDRGMQDYRAELQVYGVTHAEIMVRACKRWRLPDALGESLNYTEKPEGSGSDAKLRACIAVSSRLAYLAKHGHSENSRTIPSWGLELLGLSHRNLAGLVEEAGLTIVAAQMPF